MSLHSKNPSQERAQHLRRLDYNDLHEKTASFPVPVYVTSLWEKRLFCSNLRILFLTGLLPVFDLADLLIETHIAGMT